MNWGSGVLWWLLCYRTLDSQRISWEFVMGGAGSFFPNTGWGGSLWPIRLSTGQHSWVRGAQNLWVGRETKGALGSVTKNREGGWGSSTHLWSQYLGGGGKRIMDLGPLWATSKILSEKGQTLLRKWHLPQGFPPSSLRLRQFIHPFIHHLYTKAI